MARCLPGTPAPALTLPLSSGEQWTLVDERPDAFTLLVFYRHGKCSVCRSYLRRLERLCARFAALGVDCIAISTACEADAYNTVREWGLHSLRIAHSLPLAAADDWGLFLSRRRRDQEPEIFCEPGLFLIDRSGQLYYSSVQSMPFGRTSLDELLDWIPRLLDRPIAARGEVGAAAQEMNDGR